MELPYPEAAVIEADTLAEQTLLLASELSRPAARARRLLLLARRRDRGALVRATSVSPSSGSTPTAT